ncbi:hypothetical protein P3S67_017344 [Capsicum chacoense]
MDVDGTKEVHLQEEILTDILSRLPILSLLRFKCDVRKLDWPSNPRPWRFRMYYCYDGLALIKLHDYPHYARAILLLWNPSTRESIVLPRIEFSLTIDYSCGLGYDSTSDDYKILKIDDAAHCEILALKSGSWRKIDKHPAGVFPVLSDTKDSLAFVHVIYGDRN